MERVQGLDESLVTVSVKIPRWVQDVFITVGRDADLKFGETLRIVLTAVARIMVNNWKRGPALSAFLEKVEIPFRQAG